MRFTDGVQDDGLFLPPYPRYTTHRIHPSANSVGQSLQGHESTTSRHMRHPQTWSHPPSPSPPSGKGKQTRGPYLNDVRQSGGEEGLPNSDQRKGGCVNLVLRRGEDGVKNPDHLVYVIYVWPPA